MKVARMIALFLLIAFPVTASEIPGDADKAELPYANTQFLLNTFAALGEAQIEAGLDALKLLSGTEEVQSGEWERMRSLLGEFRRSGMKASGVWFASTDGSYYTLEKGLTDQTLKKGLFFPRLMAGGQASGDVVISISTGKRSATLAVPVSRNEEVIGALGLSLDLEEMSRVLDEKMRLPDDLIFYALDAKGRTALYRSSALFFRYPSDLGSKRLEEKIVEMLTKPEGLITYDFHGERTVLFRKSSLTGWIFALGFPGDKPDEAGEQLPPVLSQIEEELSAELDKIDRSLAGVAMRLSEAGLGTQEKRKLLSELCNLHSSISSCAAVDSGGRLEVIEPEAYSRHEGGDISAQEQIARLRKTGKPVLSSLINSAEGFEVVDLEHPVYSSSGEFTGSVSILLRPDFLISDIVRPLLQVLPLDLRVTEEDGRILFSPVMDELGRFLFDAPIYKPFPHLLTMREMISREKSGSGIYELREGEIGNPVKKLANWTTVGLHGTEWRILLSQTKNADNPVSGEPLSDAGNPVHDEPLKKLANDPMLTEALSSGSDSLVQEIFSEFYAEHHGLHSVRWVDALGINRCGYPEEQSLRDFDFSTLEVPSAAQILLAVSEAEESSFEAPLENGSTGVFFLVPVYSGDEYLGMIYTVRVRQ
jgi:hypothetical protein